MPVKLKTGERQVVVDTEITVDVGELTGKAEDVGKTEVIRAKLPVHEDIFYELNTEVDGDAVEMAENQNNDPQRPCKCFKLVRTGHVEIADVAKELFANTGNRYMAETPTDEVNGYLNGIYVPEENVTVIEVHCYNFDEDADDRKHKSNFKKASFPSKAQIKTAVHAVPKNV